MLCLAVSGNLFLFEQVFPKVIMMHLVETKQRKGKFTAPLISARAIAGCVRYLRTGIATVRNESQFGFLVRILTGNCRLVASSHFLLTGC